MRIAFALVALWWTITLAPDLFVFFPQDGIQNRQPPGWDGHRRQHRQNDVVVVTLFVILLLGILCLLFGFKSRIASIVVFVGMAFSRRMPWILNSGDVLLRILAFYLMFAPTGAALSVDRWVTEKGRSGNLQRLPVGSEIDPDTDERHVPLGSVVEDAGGPLERRNGES